MDLDAKSVASLRILIADDSRVVRKGIKDLLRLDSAGWEICGETADADEVVGMTKALAPDVVLLDLSMGRSGVETAKSLQCSSPFTTVVLISLQTPHVLRRIAGENGIAYCVAKSELAEELPTVLRTIQLSRNRKVS
jgi:DNA-binding NarL/FixJ family response regulator